MLTTRASKRIHKKHKKARASMQKGMIKKNKNKRKK
jgi:hypothetical protein